MAMPLLQEAETIIQKIRQQQYSDLLSHDQLLMERKEQKVFLHFGKSCRPLPRGPLPSLFCLLCSPSILTRGRIMPGEGNMARWETGERKLKPGLCLVSEEEEITFAPTYRFERLTRDKYAYTKQKATGVSPLLRQPALPSGFPHPAQLLS